MQLLLQKSNELFYCVHSIVIVTICKIILDELELFVVLLGKCKGVKQQLNRGKGKFTAETVLTT